MVSSAAPRVEDRVRTVSERYRIETELGRGGVGAVYRAVDQATGRAVALKTLERDQAVLTSLFEREYRTLAALQHPRVVEVYDYGVAEDGRRYYTMELLAGDDLAALAPLPWRRVCQIACDVATSLALLHARGLLHRDVSPRNVRLDASGRAKLIDFGALCPFGTPKEVVGTPQCMAPEVVRQEALDARADLFSLGCIVYWALTGTSAHAIRNVREAEEAHRNAPSAPSRVVQGIRAELDRLVLSLLSIDPLERPSSASEVIDRLHAIATLEDDPLVSMVESQLAGCALVGREREQTQLGQQLGRLLRGEGATLLLEGDPGMGRSRLTAALAIEARIAGVTTLQVDALAHPEPLGSLRALAHAMLHALPVTAREALVPQLSVLAQAFPELEAHVALQGAPEPLPPDPLERRVRIQRAMADWVLDVAEKKPLLVAIDDVQATDSASLGCLILLAHATQQRRLMLVGTSAIDAAGAVAVPQLARLSARVRLRGLDPSALEQLVTSSFGEVPDRTRLAQWLSRMTQGNPGHVFELLRGLVERKVIRYEAGTWVLPSELSERELPSNLEDALAARLAQLDPTARKLAQLFALHRGPLALSVCRKLLPQRPREELAQALELLVARKVLASAGDGYRFRQEVLRGVVLASLTEEARRDLHRELGRALLESYPALFSAIVKKRFEALSNAEIATALHAGWHCVRGGDKARGDPMLRGAALELTLRGEGLAEAVPVMEEALAEYRKKGRSRYEFGPLLSPLALAGTYMDFRLTYRYGPELFDLLLDVSGVGLARRLERFLGARLALMVALAVAALTFRLTVRRSLARDFRELLLSFIAVSSALVGSYIVLEDRPRILYILERLRPLGLFPEGHPVRLIYNFLLTFGDAVVGRYAAACAKGRAVLAALQTDRTASAMPDATRQQLITGVCLTLGQLESVRADDRIHDSLRVLDAIDNAVARRAELSVRSAYHAHRGERDRSQELQDELDVLAAQAGFTWREDLTGPRRMWCSLALCEDVIGLKRVYRKLDALVPEVPSLADVRDAVHACYLSERGLHAEALASHGAMFERRRAEVNAIGMMYVSVYVRILRAAGRAEQAKRVAEEALARLDADEASFVVASHGARLEHALALMDLGQHAEAQRALDALLAAQAAHDNPMLHGSTHKARALLALAMQDRESFERHLSAMEDWCRRTRNSALVAQCQRLADAGRARGFLDASKYRRGGERGERYAQIHLALNQCTTPAERFQAIVDLVVETSGAERGYLYLKESDGLRYVAPTVDLEPPDELRLALARHVRQVERSAAPKEEGSTTVIPETHASVVLTTSVSTGKQYRGLALSIPRSAGLEVVGAIALVIENDGIAKVAPAFLEELARGLWAAREARTVHVKMEA